MHAPTFPLRISAPVLALLLAPPLAPVAPTLGAVALGLVGWSFAVDLVWLARVPR